jgi:Flp pilus assembly protein TadG
VSAIPVSPRSNPLKGLHADKKGAVLVEFLIAIMPLMITFSCFVQLSQMATAKLVVKHSAIVGARAAAVIYNKNNNTPDQPKGENMADIEAGVHAALGPWDKQMATVTVKVEDSSTCADPYGMVKLTVTAAHKCNVPFGGRLMCGAVGATHTLEQAYAMPHQGARYADDPKGAECP